MAYKIKLLSDIKAKLKKPLYITSLILTNRYDKSYKIVVPVVKIVAKKTKAERRLSLRLTVEQDETLQDIANRLGYKNRSEAARMALDSFIDNNTLSYNSEKVSVEIPRVLLEELDKLLDFTGAADRHEAIRAAVRQYVQNENEFLLVRSMEYEELRSRYRKKMSPPRELEV